MPRFIVTYERTEHIEYVVDADSADEALDLFLTDGEEGASKLVASRIVSTRPLTED